MNVKNYGLLSNEDSLVIKSEDVIDTDPIWKLKDLDKIPSNSTLLVSLECSVREINTGTVFGKEVIRFTGTKSLF